MPPAIEKPGVVPHHTVDSGLSLSERGPGQNIPTSLNDVYLTVERARQNLKLALWTLTTASAQLA